MIKIMMTTDADEAAKVDAIFNEIKRYRDMGILWWKGMPCYCVETDSYTDHSGVDIPRGSLVYVFRDIGGGEAVWDIYKFGYCGEYAVSKDNEGDVAGLVNAGSSWFPF